MLPRSLIPDLKPQLPVRSMHRVPEDAPLPPVAVEEEHVLADSSTASVGVAEKEVEEETTGVLLVSTAPAAAEGAHEDADAPGGTPLASVPAAPEEEAPAASEPPEPSEASEPPPPVDAAAEVGTGGQINVALVDTTDANTLMQTATLRQLRDMCTQYGVSSAGKKGELVKRIMELRSN